MSTTENTIVFEAVTTDALAKIDRFQSRIKSLTSTLSSATKAITRSLKDGVLGQTLDAYDDVADVQGKLAGLSISDTGIRSITESAVAFSDTWSGTTAPEFLAAGYEIKNSISNLGETAIGEFTRITALTGKATRTSTAEMANLFASGYSLYRRQFDAFGAETLKGWTQLGEAERDIRFGQYFSAGIVSAVERFKTSGSAMSAAMSTLGSSATSANVPFAEQLAVLGRLQSEMPGADVAAKYRAFINGAYQAGEKLGLQFTDLSGNLKSMPEILTQVATVYGTELNAVETDKLRDAFGGQAMEVIRVLLPQVDVLKGDTDALFSELERGMEKTRKAAEAMERGPRKAMSVLSQQVTNLASTVGGQLSPWIESATRYVGNFTMELSGVITENPWIVDTGAMLGAGLYAVTGALQAVSSVLDTVQTSIRTFQNVVSGVKNIMDEARAGMALLKGAFTEGGIVFRIFQGIASGVRTVMWGLNLAFRASPIGLVVTAVTALAGAAYLLYKNWEPIKAWFSGLWTSIGNGIQGVMQKIGSVTKVVSKITGFFGFDGNDEKKNMEIGSVTKELAANNINYKNTIVTGEAGGNDEKKNTQIGSVTKELTANNVSYKSNISVEETAGDKGFISVSKIPDMPKPITTDAANRTDYGTLNTQTMSLPQQTLAEPGIGGGGTIEVSVTFGDIIVQAEGGRIDAEALRQQIEPVIQETVRKVLNEEDQRRLHGAA